MNWLRIYDELIADRRLNPPADGEYVEVHHVVPRCMGGSNAPSNLIPLRPEDHFFGHVLLAKHYGTSKLWAAVKIMSERSGKDSSSYSRIWKMYGLSRRMCNQRLKGAGHAHYDHTVYEFINRSGKIVRCTQFNLRTKYNLDAGNLSYVISGRLKSHREWTLLSKSQEPGFFWGLPSGHNSYRTDQTIRLWRHKDGDEFEGTTYDLAQSYDLLSNALSNVANGKEASSQNWYLAERFAHFPTASFLKAHTRVVMKIKHTDGRILEGPRPIVMAKAGLTFNDTSRLVNGKAISAKGWSLFDTDLRQKRPRRLTMEMPSS